MKTDFAVVYFHKCLAIARICWRFRHSEHNLTLTSIAYFVRDGSYFKRF